jgi:hypothetical protein
MSDEREIHTLIGLAAFGAVAVLLAAFWKDGDDVAPASDPLKPLPLYEAGSTPWYLQYNAQNPLSAWQNPFIPNPNQPSGPDPDSYANYWGQN